MNGLIGGLYHVSEWMSRFVITNLLWLFFNLPIVFIFINIIFADQREHQLLLMSLFVLLAPFIFFPATAAMFASVRDWIIKEDSRSLLKPYWDYYKENYKRSVCGGFVLTVLWVIWAADYYYFSKVSIILMFTFVIMGGLLFVYSVNFFSVMSHYRLKLRTLLKHSLLITVGSPLLLFTVFLSSGIILYVSMNGPLFLLLFCTGSLISFISFSAFYRLYLKLTIAAND